MKLVAIVQSNYIPWKGYFDLINMADEFILLDEVDYTTRDWRNRNKIKTPNGLLWLTIPISKPPVKRWKINETQISQPAWNRHHWESIRRSYSKAPSFQDYGPIIKRLYHGISSNNLSEVNHFLLTELCQILGIKTAITRSRDYGTIAGKTMRLVDLCQKAGATSYLSGPAASDYLDINAFETAGINVEWMDYSGYPEYRQLYGDFCHGVSIIDLILNEGDAAPNFLLSTRNR